MSAPSNRVLIFRYQIHGWRGDRRTVHQQSVWPRRRRRQKRLRHRQGHRLRRALSRGRLLLHRRDHGRQRQPAAVRPAKVHREREAGHEHRHEHTPGVRQWRGCGQQWGHPVQPGCPLPAGRSQLLRHPAGVGLDFPQKTARRKFFCLEIFVSLFSKVEGKFIPWEFWFLVKKGSTSNCV